MFHTKKGVAFLLASLLSLSPITPVLASDVSREAPPINVEAFDALVASGKIASPEDIQSSSWASAIQDAGVLRVGSTRTSFLFSQLDRTDENIRGVDTGLFKHLPRPDQTDKNIRGFDAGLFKLLTRYLLGDETAYELTLVDSSTREQVLQNGEVDVVFATYSITEDRAKCVSFAGPYYTSRQAVLTQARNTQINGIEDLEGKIVAIQAGSTGRQILEEITDIEMKIQEFETDQQARMALKLGRVDAYVSDYTLHLNAIVKSPSDYRIAGEQFGPEDNYGVGLPLGSDGVDFVNTFLQSLFDDGTWAKLWQITLGDRTEIDTPPPAPVISQNR